jgi:transposase
VVNLRSGKPSKLTDEQTNRLTRLILKPATKYGYDTDFWTIRRIIDIAKKYLKIKISKSTMHRILYNENYSYKKPEKRYMELFEKRRDERSSC